MVAEYDDDIIICEKCGAVMETFVHESSLGMTCPNCGHGWARTWSPRDEWYNDLQKYVISLETVAPNSLKADVIRAVSAAAECNFLEARQKLLSGSSLSEADALETKRRIQTLKNAGVSFAVTPEFLHSLD